MTDIVVIDGHALFADLLCAVLADHGYRVVGSACSSGSAVDLVAATRPALCLVDHRSLPDEHGPGALERLVAAGGGRTRVLVVTDSADEGGMRLARAVGASGYLDKGCGVTALMDALALIARGEVVMRLPRRAPVVRSGAAGAVHRLAAALTVRERECLGMLVEGATTAQMVEELGISVMTVRSHVRSVLCKLGVHSRLEAASLAVRHGLVDTREPHAV